MVLGKHGFCSGVGLQEADSISLIQKKIEVSGGVGCYGLELSLLRGRAKSRQRKLLRPGRLRPEWRGAERYQARDQAQAKYSKKALHGENGRGNHTGA